jgi:nitronate monooxygenase
LTYSKSIFYAIISAYILSRAIFLSFMILFDLSSHWRFRVRPMPEFSRGVATMIELDTVFTKQVGCKYPIIGGAMYPCSNPELVAAVSKAGAIGIVQPASMVYVHKRDFRAGIRFIREQTSNPIGVNLLIEKSSKTYLERNKTWLEASLAEGVRFFITALGDPRWVVDIAKKHGAVVYHDVTAGKWAAKAVEGGVDGLICVNSRAGGHAGHLGPKELLEEVKSFGLPVICAGGIGDEKDFVSALSLGYAGVQIGTRFIATTECTAHADYKNAILAAESKDIVLTQKITGVPVAVIKTPYIEKIGITPGPVARFILAHPRTKHFARMFYTLRSFWQLKKSNEKGSSYKDFFQAGKSVAGIKKIEPAEDIIRRFVEYAAKA